MVNYVDILRRNRIAAFSPRLLITNLFINLLLNYWKYHNLECTLVQSTEKRKPRMRCMCGDDLHAKCPSLSRVKNEIAVKPAIIYNRPTLFSSIPSSPHSRLTCASWDEIKMFLEYSFSPLRPGKETETRRSATLKGIHVTKHENHRISRFIWSGIEMVYLVVRCHEFRFMRADFTRMRVWPFLSEFSLLEKRGAFPNERQTLSVIIVKLHKFCFHF